MKDELIKYIKKILDGEDKKYAIQALVEVLSELDPDLLNADKVTEIY